MARLRHSAAASPRASLPRVDRLLRGARRSKRQRRGRRRRRCGPAGSPAPSRPAPPPRGGAALPCRGRRRSRRWRSSCSLLGSRGPGFIGRGVVGATAARTRPVAAELVADLEEPRPEMPAAGRADGAEGVDRGEGADGEPVPVTREAEPVPPISVAVVAPSRPRAAEVDLVRGLVGAVARAPDRGSRPSPCRRRWRGRRGSPPARSAPGRRSPEAAGRGRAAGR